MTAIDNTVRALTGWDSFADMLNTQGSYRPTIRPDANDRRYEILADAYDREQKARGDSRRAWRGGTTIGHRFEPVAAVGLTSLCPHGKLSNQCCGNAEWLQVVHAINKAWRAEHDDDEARMILTPIDNFEQPGGRWFEEYPEFRIILAVGGSRGGRIVAMTDRAAAALSAAVLEVTGRAVA